MRVGPGGHDLLEVVNNGGEHGLVNLRQLKLLSPRLELLPFLLQFRHPCVQVFHLLVAEAGFYGPGFECLEVTVQAGPGFRHPVLDPCYLIIYVRLLGGEKLIRLLPNTSHELLVLEHGLHILDDRRFEYVRPHVVLVALVGVPAFGADVIGELPSPAPRAYPDHVALAPVALDGARQDAFLVAVQAAAVEVVLPLGQHFTDLIEERLGDDGLVHTLVDRLQPAELAHVERALDDIEDDPLIPLLAATPPVACLVELTADGLSPFHAESVHLEHLLDDDSLFLVYDEALFGVERVAVGDVASDPLAALGLLLHADLGALYNRCVLELGEDPEHLEHHLSCGIGCIERLGYAL